jgi:hypothetical protein
MCLVILYGNEPFQDIKRKDLYGAICSGRRPELPEDIPTELTALIAEGWASDRKLRPSFLDVCTRLEKLRHRLLRIHSFGISLKHKEQAHSNLYRGRMLKRRCLAYKHYHSQVSGVQASELTTCNPTTEEMFDAIEVSFSRVINFVKLNLLSQSASLLLLT